MEQSTVPIQHTFAIPFEYAGLRLDIALARCLPEYSRSLIQSWILEGKITCNSQLFRPRDPAILGDIIVINAVATHKTSLMPEAIPLDIAFEDDDLMIINKPPGLVVHPGSGNWHGTLVNALLHHCPALALLPRAGLIHRIDKETSGLLMIAKTLPSYTALVEQLRQRKITRQYLGLVQGTLISGGKVDAPIGRHPHQRTKMAVVERGKTAVTHYRIAERFKHYTLLDIHLETGRTHQIRVHMAKIGYPLVGDPLYNPRPISPKQCPPDILDMLRDFKRQALHAACLRFTHPIKQSIQACEVRVPDDMLNLLTALRNDNKLNETS